MGAVIRGRWLYLSVCAGCVASIAIVGRDGASVAITARGHEVARSVGVTPAARLVEAGARRNASRDAWALGARSMAITRNGWRHRLLVARPARAVAVSVLGTETVIVERAGHRGDEVVVATFVNGAHHWHVQRPIALGAAYQVGSAEIVAKGGQLAGVMVSSTGNLPRGLWLSPRKGKAWRVRRTPTVGAVTEWHGLWLVGGPLRSAIYHSRDVGRSWQRVSLPVGLRGPVALSPVEVSPGESIVTATNKHDLQVVVGSPGFAGIHWTKGPTLRLGGVYGGGAMPPTGIAGSTLWVWTGGHIMRLSLASGHVSYVTPSGLRHEGDFTLHPTGARTAWASDFDVRCESHATSCARIGTLETTADGGKTWHTIPNPVSP